MNPYDLLDLAPDATDAEIRAAWKGAIADLDPGDRRFRAYNQAAEMLLDPQRRAAYDAEHAEELAPEPEPVVPEPAESEPVSLTQDPAPSTTPSTAPSTATTSTGVPTWLLVGVGVLTLALIAVTTWLWTQPSDQGVEEATRAAQSAAERAVVPILSYDYRHLDEDQAAAQSYMTSDYRSDYDKLFEVIKQNAPATETTVTVTVVASGIVRSGEDRADILLFVNRPTTNKRDKQPTQYKDQVTLTMEKVGDDWLVDNMVTSPVQQ